MRRLFLFRPEPGARHSADQARALGLEATLIPLFTIEPVEWTAPDPTDFDALLLTSANALRACGDQLDRLRSLPAHCVGQVTATAATVAGLGVASIGTGNVYDLLRPLPDTIRLLHLCGEDRRSAEEDRANIQAVTVYRAVALERPKGLDAVAGNVAAVHSPRAARRLADLLSSETKSTVRLVAISPAAADAAGPGWERVEAPAKPTDTALLALCARLCDS